MEAISTYIVIPFLISTLLGCVTIADVGKDESSSTSTVIVLVEGRKSTVKCASVLVDDDSETNNMSIVFFLKWTAPKYVNLKQSSTFFKYGKLSNASSSTITMKQTNSISNSEVPSSKSWVESTSEGDLIFHFPTSSQTGQYRCRSISPEGEVFDVYSVFVRVVKESHFDIGYRTKIGLIAAGILASFIIAICAWRIYKRKKSQEYVKTQTQELITIPTITILDVHGRKVEDNEI